MFKGVIFDIDGTLYDYKSADFAAMNHFCLYIEKNLGVKEKIFREIYTEARKIIHEQLKDTAASHSRVLMIQIALELLNKKTCAHVLELYDVYWDYFLRSMRPFDGVTEFLRGLKQRGIKISTCTDMTAHIQYRKIYQLGLDKFIDFMVTSEETGSEKPASIMFNLALKKMNLRADETAFFGDSLERDILGAANVGITPFWFIADSKMIHSDVYKKICSYRDAELIKIFGGD